MSDDKIRIEGIDATLIGHALTFNTPTEDGMGVAAQYVILTPKQAESVRSFFLNHHGEREDRSVSEKGDRPTWLNKTPAQAAAAAETSRYVADMLPADDPRKGKARMAAGIMEEVSRELNNEKQAAMEDEDE